MAATQTILKELIQEAMDEGYLLDIALDLVTAYIDTRARQPYLGLTLLPREPRLMNKYDETDMQFISVIADDSGRYSTSVKKKRSQSAHLEVSFGHYDIAVDITGQEIDKIIHIFDIQDRQAAMNYLLGLLRKLLRYAVDDKHELMAMTAILEAKIKLVGADKRNFTLNMKDPTGHRINVNGAWSDDTYNPVIEDILPAVDFLTDKGFQIRGMYCRNNVARLLQSNEQVTRLLTPDINIQPNLQVTLDGIANYLARQRVEENLPGILTYDRFYHTQTKTEFFMPNDVFLIVCRTPRDRIIAMENGQSLLLPSTLGYFGIGTPQTQTTPGDIINVLVHDEKKPTYIEAEQYGCGSPVVQEPESILVLKGIS